MKKPVFYVVLAIGILAVLAGIYFLIPGIYHPYISIHSESGLYLVDPAKYPRIVKSVHRYYAVAAFAFGLVFLAIAFFVRPRARKQSLAV